jgi:hypothetical protein
LMPGGRRLAPASSSLKEVRSIISENTRFLAVVSFGPGPDGEARTADAGGGHLEVFTF